MQTNYVPLISKSDVCRLGGGLTEDDLLGGQCREPLRTCCIELADTLWALYGSTLDHASKIQSPIIALKACANTELGAAHGGLDRALRTIATVLDPVCVSQDAPLARLDSLEKIVSAIQMAAMIRSNAGAPLPAASEVDMETDLDPTAKAISSQLRDIAQLLGVNNNNNNNNTLRNQLSSASELASAIQKSCIEISGNLPPGFFAPLLPQGSLDDGAMATLEEVNDALHAEYSLRRRMLIERARVTLQSLLCSKKLDMNSELRASAEAAAEAADSRMVFEPNVSINKVFQTLLPDLLPIMEKATSGETGIHSSVKSVKIGKVPDRGGRPEGQARVADMPQWTARKVSSGGRGGVGKGRGRSRGSGRFKK